MKKYCLILCFLALAGAAFPSGYGASAKMQPRWIKHTPTSDVPYISFVVVPVLVDDLSQMNQAAQRELRNYMPRAWVADNSAVTKNDFGTKSEIIDTYWERTYSGKYRCYVLFQVAQPGYELRPFYTATPTDNYGFGAVALSIIPGAGQMYKGQYAKGGVIMGVSAGLVAGIVVTQAQRTVCLNHADVAKESKKKQFYKDQANGFAVGSYVCIGALGALWIYNLIDAGVSPGARRISRSKYPNRDAITGWNVQPVMFDYNSFGLQTTLTF